MKNNHIITSIFLSLIVMVISAYGSYSLLKAHLGQRNEPVLSCKQEACDLVVEGLKNNHSVYLNNVWSTMGFLLIAIGWIITSDKARNYWKNSNLIRNICLSVIVVLMVFHITILFNASFESQRIYDSVKNIPGAAYYQINTSFALIVLQVPRLESPYK